MAQLDLVKESTFVKKMNGLIKATQTQNGVSVADISACCADMQNSTLTTIMCGYLSGQTVYTDAQS